ncbi:MAG: PAS domain-containing protein, partial [Oligoflexia bacterium]|nr:PAS domain-containing protein [Oligoflexia bacterium]
MIDKNKRDLFRIFFKKIALVQLVLYILLFIILGSIASWYLKQYILKQTKEELTSELSIIKYFLERQSEGISPTSILNTKVCDLKLKAPHLRITLINFNGDVLCDSDFDIKNMTNHLDRPEIILAKNKTEGRIGFAEHFSKTLSMNMLYGATTIKIVNQNYFLRVAIPIKDIDQIIKIYYHSFFIFILPLLIFGPLIGLIFVYKASGPTNVILERLNVIKNKVLKQHSLDSTKIDSSDDQLINSILDQTEVNIDQKLNELIIENAKLNALMESTKDPIVAIDTNEVIWFANKRVISYFLNNDSDCLNRNYERLKIKDIFRQHSNIKESFVKTIKSGLNCTEKNIVLFFQEGNTHFSFHFDLNINPIINTKTNQIIGAMGVFHDITERILSEQMKEDFVCNISHEVRTPLSSIQGFFQLFKQTVELTSD